MKIKIMLTKIRNPLHDHPLMRKGGVHVKSKKSKRRVEKQKLKNEWGPLKIFMISVFKEIHLAK